MLLPSCLQAMVQSNLTCIALDFSASKVPIAACSELPVTEASIFFTLIISPYVILNKFLDKNIKCIWLLLDNYMRNYITLLLEFSTVGLCSTCMSIFSSTMALEFLI